MKRLFVPYYLFLMMLAFACSEPPEEVIEKDITVAEVQEAFAAISNSLPGGRQDTIGIDWDNARYKDTSVGDALTFPLENAKNAYISTEENGVLYPVQNAGYAFAYKSEEGDVALEYVQTVPTADTEEFTGVVSVSDWNAGTKYAFFYENGVLQTPENNGRVESDCVEYYHFNCTSVTVNGVEYGDYCVLDRISTVCSTNQAPPVLAPGDYGEPSTGGSPSNNDPGTSGSNNLCPHPTIEGQYVNCDDNRCLGSPCCDKDGQLIRDCIKDIPCLGKPLKDMSQIASPGASGINGGRYGCTRNGSGCSGDPSKRFHDGLDISANIGTYVFSAFEGKVVKIVKNLDPNEYKKKSYGNYVTIESFDSHNNKYRMRYGHLDYVNVSLNQNVGPGYLLGRTGTTGNATNVDNPHVHFQVRALVNGSWQEADPESYLHTQYNQNGQEMGIDPCLSN